MPFSRVFCPETAHNRTIFPKIAQKGSFGILTAVAIAVFDKSCRNYPYPVFEMRESKKLEFACKGLPHSPSCENLHSKRFCSSKGKKPSEEEKKQGLVENSISNGLSHAFL